MCVLALASTTFAKAVAQCPNLGTQVCADEHVLVEFCMEIDGVLSRRVHLTFDEVQS
jgi:hypothetical protein